MVAFFKQHNCKDELKEFDLKATPARIAVMKFLETSDRPVDVNSVIDYLKKEEVAANPATIFRIMNAFTDKGITRNIQFQEGKTRYELLSKGDHHHLICTNCGRIEDIPDMFMEDFEKEIKNKRGFLVKSHSLEFFGLCKNCQS